MLKSFCTRALSIFFGTSRDGYTCLSLCGKNEYDYVRQSFWKFTWENINSHIKSTILDGDWDFKSVKSDKNTIEEDWTTFPAAQEREREGQQDISKSESFIY